MASNDERWTPEVKGEDLKNLITSTNEALRLIFQYLHTLEGRLGEIALRDGVSVAGDVTVAGRVVLPGAEDEPEVSETDQAMLFYSTVDDEIKKSTEAGEWSPILTPDVISPGTGAPAALATVAGIGEEGPVGDTQSGWAELTAAGGYTIWVPVWE